MHSVISAFKSNKKGISLIVSKGIIETDNSEGKVFSELILTCLFSLGLLYLLTCVVNWW